MSEHFRKVLEEEEREIAAIRKKRQAGEEMFRQEKTKRTKERELSELRTLEKQVLDKLNKEKKKNSQLFLEASAWEIVFKSKVDELKLKQEELDRNYEKIWQNREEFCSQVDGFIRDFENFTKSDDNVNDREIKRHIKEIECDIESLGSKIAEKEAAGEILDKKLEKLEKERTSLLDERESPDVKRLQDWILITCEKCAELENQIAQKKERINEKNADLMKSARSKKNNLFSIVSLDDVKKLSPFKTDSKPSCSLNLSLK